MKAKKARRTSELRANPPAEKSKQPPVNSTFVVSGVCVVLAIVTVIVYAQTFWFGFVAYDDDQYVYENPILKSGITASAVKWALTTYHSANWHPLTWISYLFEAQIFGINTAELHVVNVMLHAGSAVLLFLFLFRMTHRLWRSSIVAAVFALHPLHVESVAWIAERKDVLSTFLAMVAFGIYLNYIRRPAASRYVLLCFAFALSLMAKPMLVTFPLVLLLLDFWPLQRIHWPLRWHESRLAVIEKLPLLVMSAVSSVLTVAAQRSYGAVASLTRVPFTVRMENAAISYVKYIQQTFWPEDLAVLYPAAPPVPANAIFALLVLLAISAAALLVMRTRPYIFTGWFWYLGMLVPVIGIIQVGAQSHADRYMYVPQVGLALVVVWAIADYIEAHPGLKQAAAAAALVIMIVFAAGTWHQIGFWSDSRMLFQHTLAVTERNAVIQNNLGVILARADDWTGAVSQYQQALAINPEYPEAHANFGHALLRSGKFEEARAHLLEAVRLKPDLAIALADLGLLDAAAGNFPDAIWHLDESLRISPDNSETHSNLCFALQHAGRVSDAIAQCREALRLKPDNKDAQFNLRNLLN